MNSDYDDLLIDLAALLSILYVAFRANGVPASDMTLLLPTAGFIVGLYFAIQAIATALQGFRRERRPRE